MKLKNIILLIMAFSINTALLAQQKPAAPKKPATATKKPATPKITKCHITSGDTAMIKLTLDQAKAWSDSLPLNVLCDGMKKYKLYNFNFTIISMSPFQTKEFGTGNGGIPILARRAVDDLKPKDAVVIKEATYLDDKGVEQKLPVISFSIIE
jgi:hypothetical protein